LCVNALRIKNVQTLKTDLLRKFLQDKCTPEEIHQILLWAESRNEREVIDHLVEKGWYDIPKDTSDPEKYRLIWNGIENEIHPDKKRRRYFIDYFYYTKIAATIAIFVSVGLFFIMNKASSPSREVVPVEIAMVTKATNWGEKLLVYLPDQSVVHLNSGSSISYPSSFGDHSREVQLSGEAFFQVMKDNNRVFRVKSGSVVTSVLGTSFNINTHDNIKVSLLEGKVQLEDSGNGSIILQPGDVATYADQKFHISKINEPSLAWRHGIIHFEQASLSSVLERLENWYGVKINAEKNIDLKQTISGSFPNQNLKNILDGLCFAVGCKFEMTDKNVKLFN
jgi:transmembrane sensor